MSKLTRTVTKLVNYGIVNTAVMRLCAFSNYQRVLTCSFSTTSYNRLSHQLEKTEECPKILITGSLGQLGTELAAKFREMYGRDSVLMTDILKAPKHVLQEGAFGPTSPRNPTPNLTIQRPRTIYGVSKVHAELMGEYYNHKFGVDFRSLRFPGVVSANTHRGGGASDYSVDIFHAALATGKYTCYLRKDTRLPMTYIDDCVRSIVEFMNIPDDKLKLRTYNVQAMSFTPEEIASKVKERLPHFQIEYKPDSRQEIADSWPMVFDDSGARSDWGWKPQYELDDVVKLMFDYLEPMYTNKSTVK